LKGAKLPEIFGLGRSIFLAFPYQVPTSEIDYFAGLYSSDNKPEFDGAFKYGQFGILSLGRDYADKFNLEKSYFRLDFMFQDDDGNDEVEDFNDWNGAYSFVTKWENNAWYFWTDLSFADRKDGDVWGIQLMPFFDITDKIQVIFCYTHLESSGDDQLRASRWEDRLDRGAYRGDDLT
jgi:phosphate-selective porin OprO/OprP